MTTPPKTPPIVAPVPRITLTIPEAAAALGISRDTFDTLVAPYVRMIRHGRLRLIPIAELDRWAADTARPTIDTN